MNTFYLHLKRFVRNRALWGSFWIFVLAILAVLIDYMARMPYPPPGSHGVTIHTLSQTLMLSPLFYIYFLIISFETAHAHIQLQSDESINVTRHGRLRFLVGLVLVLILLLSGFVLLVLAVNLLALAVLQSPDQAAILHALGHIFLKCWLFPFSAILIGTACAFVRNRLKGYLILLVIVYLSSPYVMSLFYTILGFVPNIGDKIQPLLRYFDFSTPSMNTTIHASFGFALPPGQFDLAWIWITAALAILLILVLRTGMRTVRALIILLVLANLGLNILYGQPQSSYIIETNLRHTRNKDTWFYESIDVREYAADFQITRYDLEFRIGRKVNVRAMIDVDHADLPVYRLTLYHPYRVNRVETASGLTLPFSQEGDHLIIQRTGGVTIDRIVLHYGGISNEYYAMTQGALLPGFFAYYPRAGHSRLYDEDLGFLPQILPKPVPFHVKIHTQGNWICNLPQIHPGEFAGISDGLTLVCGFYRERNVGTTRVIYPYLNWPSPDLEELPEQVGKAVEEGMIQQNTRTIFLLSEIASQSAYQNFSQYADHCILSSFHSLKQNYELQKVKPWKYPLHLNLTTYNQHKADFMNHARDIFRTFSPEQVARFQKQSVLLSFADLIWSKGEQVVIDACRAYLDNPSGTQTSMEFLVDLKTRLPDLPPDKQNRTDPENSLTDAVNEYRTDRKQFMDAVSYLRALVEIPFDSRHDSWVERRKNDIRTLLFEAIESRGEADALAACDAYLSDPDVQQDARSFLRQLKEGNKADD